MWVRLILPVSHLQADKADERRRRGDSATQTSDARFDEKFQLGHNMHGRAHTPWYAAGVATASEAPRCMFLYPAAALREKYVCR